VIFNRGLADVAGFSLKRPQAPPWRRAGAPDGSRSKHSAQKAQHFACELSPVLALASTANHAFIGLPLPAANLLPTPGLSREPTRYRGGLTTKSPLEDTIAKICAFGRSRAVSIRLGDRHLLRQQRRHDGQSARRARCATRRGHPSHCRRCHRQLHGAHGSAGLQRGQLRSDRPCPRAGNRHRCRLPRSDDCRAIAGADP